MLHRILCIFVVLACLTSPVQAAVTAGSFTLSPMVGGYLFEGDQSLEHSALGSLGLGYNLSKLAALEAVFVYTEAEASDSSTTDTTVKSLRLDALYHFSPDSRLVPYFAVGMGGITLNPDGAGDRDHFLLNYGGGIKYFFNDNVALRADVRHLLDFRKPDNNLLYSAGLLFQFGAPAPAAKPALVPAAPAAAPVSVAPTVASAPAQPAPTVLDSDGDGVIDAQDQCPETPQAVSIDQQGCPTKLTLRINFDLDSTSISSDFDDELAKAARCINDYPGNSVFIDGHTDYLGAAHYNQGLSVQRANAVKNSLSEKFNIPAERMIARGFGETQPIADNRTTEGLFQNRRVEVSCGASN